MLPLTAPCLACKWWEASLSKIPAPSTDWASSKGAKKPVMIDRKDTILVRVEKMKVRRWKEKDKELGINERGGRGMTR
jgi:hypothetical protein